MKEAKKGSTYALSVPSQEKKVRDSYENSWLSGRKKHANKNKGLYIKMKEAKKGSTYTLSVSSQAKGG